MLRLLRGIEEVLVVLFRIRCLGFFVSQKMSLLFCFATAP
jgi:hypothetical protein